MCNKAVDKYPLLLVEVPDHLKTQKMCNKVLKTEPAFLIFVHDRLKTQEIYNKAVRNWPWPSFIPDHLKTQGTCNEITQAMQMYFTGSLNTLKNKACVEDEKSYGS